MKSHHLPVAEVLASLRSGAEGLSGVEAGRRLAEFGPNRVRRTRTTHPVWHFLEGFTHFFALILWAAAGLAFVAEWQDPGGGMATLGYAIIGVIVINALFSFWQEHRAERALAALQKLLPHQIKVLRDGKVCVLGVEEIVPGDVVLLDDGDDVPADCRLIQAQGVRVNNATITGESLPQSRDERPDTGEELLHSRNVLLAGTSMVAGHARAVVFATGAHTEFGKIAHLVQNRRDRLSPLQREIVRLSHFVAVLSVLVGVICFCAGRWLGLPFWQNFLFAIGIIVANVPEGLLPTVTLALALGSQRMAKRNALIRNLPSVETLGSATVICTDKTGTLTENRMAVRRLFLAGQFCTPAEAGRFAGNDCPSRPFFEGAFLCHDLRQADAAGTQTVLGDPMEVALVGMARAACPELTGCPRLGEVPFDSDRRRLSTLHDTPAGPVLYTKGALETLLPRCTRALVGDEVLPLNPELGRRFLAAQDTLARDGLRVLAFAYRPVSARVATEELEEGLTLTGLVGLHDPPRPEVPDAIARCQSAGIQVIMVTGDHPHTAEAIARQIGLVATDSPVVLTGEQVRRLSPTQLQLALDAPEILFARVSAEQKMRVVQALRAKGHVVAVTGDGVNDAPALRQADIGVAMGLAGTDVAREAADIVLVDDNFASIVAAVEEGRAVFANMQKFLTYILTHNVAELLPYLAFVFLRVPLPLTVMQILAIDLGTDTLPALALGAERPEEATMRRPPRSRKDGLLSAGLLLRSYLFLGLLEGVGAMTAFFFVLVAGGWQHGQPLAATDPLYLRATTACLCAIVVLQMANLFLCRSERESVWAFGLRGNPLLLGGVATALGLILLLVYTPAGNLLFGTAPLSGWVWLLLVPCALALAGVEELRKWLVRSLFPLKGVRK